MKLAALLLLAASTPDYRLALPGYRYQFPRDHFEHSDFRTEWWYYTGNLTAAGGNRYGFELVFFRQGQRDTPRDNASAWRIDDLYLAHLALTDIDGHRFLNRQRLNRSGPGIAGASFEQARVWNGNWQAKWETATSQQTLTAIAEGVRLELRLSPRKPPVIHGENGVSQKASGPGKASHYVSFTRLAAAGSVNGVSVTGEAWMDHEWFTHQLESAQTGWDWFSAQLENGSELMLFQLRLKGGGTDPYSSGTYVAPDGSSRHLKREDFALEPVESWKSPRTGATYPVRWKITVPSLRIALECRAAIPEQELVPEQKGSPVYWEGAVTYNGSSRGVGYLEMTGYDKPVKL
jgi:predicted secreted hydrolase